MGIGCATPLISTKITVCPMTKERIPLHPISYDISGGGFGSWRRGGMRREKIQHDGIGLSESRVLVWVPAQEAVRACVRGRMAW